LETVSEFGNLVSYLFTFGTNDLVESLKEFNVVCGSNIEYSLKFLLHHACAIDHSLVSEAAHTRQSYSEFLWHFKLAYEFHSHFSKGIIRPSHEPVEGSVVDESWEHSAVVYECLPDGTHADRDVEIVLNSVKEELLDGVWGVKGTSRLFVWLSALFSYLSKLICQIEIGDDSCAKLVVNVFKE
jgi:hypothetical protein